MHEWQHEWPLWTGFLRQKREAPARSERNFYARKGNLGSIFQRSLTLLACMGRGVICQITHSTFQHVGLPKHLVGLNSARAAQIGSICALTFLFFFSCLVIVSSMAHPPRSCNATGAGVYGMSMRNNLAEVSVSLQSVIRRYRESWKTPGT